MKRIAKPLFLLFLISFVSAQVFSQKIKHVILIGSDGFGAYAFEKAKIPNLRTMMKEGSWSLHARTVLPSSSAANWASMVMGAGPELHGYTTWRSKKSDMPPREVDDHGMFPSLYSQLRKEKPDSEIGVIYKWDGIGYLFPKAAVNKDQNADGDIAVTNAAAAYIKEKKPNFLFIHLHDVDSVGHKIGHGTPEYYAAIERTDTHIGTILKSIKDAGTAESTAVLFTAGHGGIN